MSSKKNRRIPGGGKSEGSSEFLSLVIETANAMIVTLDKKGDILIFNGHAERVTGYDRKDIAGKSFLNTLVHSHNRKLVKRIFRDIIDGRNFHNDEEIQILDKFGVEHFVSCHNSALMDKQGTPSGILIVGIDLTQRHHMEKDLKRLHTAVEQAAETIIITDSDGVIQYVNPVFEKLTGYSRLEILGKTPAVLKGGRHGKTFYRKMWKTLESGKTWAGHFINRKKSGELYEEDAVISPVTDPDGRITNYVAVKRDVTEKIALEHLLSESMKLDAINHFASGIAHDFNNTVMIISNTAEMMRQQLKPESGLAEDIEAIISAATRAKNLTNQLLSFSKKGNVEMDKFDLNTRIGDLVTLLDRLLSENITLVFRAKTEKCLIKSNPGQLDQALLNLVINSRDAMPDGGKVSISTDTVKYSAGEPANLNFVGNIDPTPGKYVKLSVKDNGIGMDDETVKNVFNPLFSTKNGNRSSGFGLSSVLSIVRQSNGYISVRSAKGEGTEFILFFPAKQAVVGLC